MRAIVITIVAVYLVSAGPAAAEDANKTNSTASQVTRTKDDTQKAIIRNIKARQAPQKDVHQQPVTHSGGSRGK
jgi:hypothetical protein